MRRSFPAIIEDALDLQRQATAHAKALRQALGCGIDLDDATVIAQDEDGRGNRFENRAVHHVRAAQAIVSFAAPELQLGCHVIEGRGHDGELTSPARFRQTQLEVALADFLNRAVQRRHRIHQMPDELEINQCRDRRA